MEELLNEILDDIHIELKEEFHRNFERKAFFSESWQPTKKTPKIGSLLLRTGYLRRSINSHRDNLRIVFTSSAPYADIHNGGGIINRTSKRGKPYTINIPKRQFIGISPEISELIDDVIDDRLTPQLQQYIAQYFNS